VENAAVSAEPKNSVLHPEQVQPLPSQSHQVAANNALQTLAPGSGTAPGVEEHPASHQEPANGSSLSATTPAVVQQPDTPKQIESTPSIDASSIASSTPAPQALDRPDDTDFIQQPIQDAQLAEEQDLEAEVRRVSRQQKRLRRRRDDLTRRLEAKYVTDCRMIMTPRWAAIRMCFVTNGAEVGCE
jgi:hypothetical protein